MKEIIILTILVLFIAACAQNQESPIKDSKSTPAEQAKAEEAKILPVKCEDSDGSDIYVKGKTVVLYSDNKKETFNDYCPGEDSPFPVFQVEYMCDGNSSASKLNKCQGNCSNGVCLKP